MPIAELTSRQHGAGGGRSGEGLVFIYNPCYSLLVTRTTHGRRKAFQHTGCEQAPGKSFSLHRGLIYTGLEAHTGAGWLPFVFVCRGKIGQPDFFLILERSHSSGLFTVCRSCQSSNFKSSRLIRSQGWRRATPTAQIQDPNEKSKASLSSKERRFPAVSLHDLFLWLSFPPVRAEEDNEFGRVSAADGIALLQLLPGQRRGSIITCLSGESCLLSTCMSHCAGLVSFHKTHFDRAEIQEMGYSAGKELKSQLLRWEKEECCIT